MNGKCRKREDCFPVRECWPRNTMDKMSWHAAALKCQLCRKVFVSVWGDTEDSPVRSLECPHCRGMTAIRPLRRRAR